MFAKSSERSRPASADAPHAVTVYGTQWCAATQRVRRYLDRLHVPYTFYDMDRDPRANSMVQWWTGGDASHPTIQIGGDVLIEPAMQELQDVLVQHGLI